MKVLLVKLPELYNRKGVLKDKSIEYLGINYIAATLRKNGYDVEILAYRIKHMTEDEIIMKIIEKRADVIGFSILYDWAVEENIEFISRLRNNGYTNKIFLGGHPASFFYEKLLGEPASIDYICVGEGEITVLELLNALSNGNDVSDIKGIAYQKEGACKFNGYRKLNENLDDLPFPARDELEVALSENPDVSINISGSRGCSWSRCSFCDIQTFYGISEGAKWRSRSIKNIVDELEGLYKKYNHRLYNFVDDDFFGPAKNRVSRIKSFVNELRKRNLPLKFEFLSNVRDIDEETLKAIKYLGVESIFLGVESGVRRALKTMKKGITPQMSENAIRKVEEKGFICKCGSIFIDAYTTLSEVKENAAFWDRLNRLSIHSFNRMFIYKGTPIENELREKNMVLDNGYIIEYKKDMLDPQVNNLYEIITAIRQDIVNVQITRIKKKGYALSEKAPFLASRLIRDSIRYNNYIATGAFKEYLYTCIRKIESGLVLNIEEEKKYFFEEYAYAGAELLKQIESQLRKLSEENG